MRITATFKMSVQISPDEWNVFTEVIHLEEEMTLQQAYEVIAHIIRPGATEDFNVRIEMQFTKERPKP